MKKLTAVALARNYMVRLIIWNSVAHLSIHGSHFSSILAFKLIRFFAHQ